MTADLRETPPLGNKPDEQPEEKHGQIEQNNSTSASEAASQNAVFAKKPKRTTGLKVFDTLLYPGLTNVGVFAISVVATYLTSYGGHSKNEKGEKQYHVDPDTGRKTPMVGGSFGAWMKKRGDYLVTKIGPKHINTETGKQEGLGLTEFQADMAKMVTFSFVDGSLMAPLVKKLEDKREPIAHWIDKRLGTEPDDSSVYDAEPKQSWKSVLGGRFATAAVVVPTAVALSKIGKNLDTGKWGLDHEAKNKAGHGDAIDSNKNFDSLNEILFEHRGREYGKKISQPGGKAEKLNEKLDVPGLSKTIVFEAFYTSVCTAGLYFSSRFFARKSKANKEQHHHHDEKNVTLSSTTNTTSAPADERQTENPMPHRTTQNGRDAVVADVSAVAKEKDIEEGQPALPRQRQESDWVNRSANAAKETGQPALSGLR